jgi:hypothetical protein
VINTQARTINDGVGMICALGTENCFAGENSLISRFENLL